jgi:hypothetical protein
MFTECSLNVHCMSAEFSHAGIVTQLAPPSTVQMALPQSPACECSPNVHWMFTECSLNVHWMFTECSLDVHWMFTACWLSFHMQASRPNWHRRPQCGWHSRYHLRVNVHWIITKCSLNVHWMLTGCSLNVHWMFTESSMNVHWMFTECSLNVQWIFSERSLGVHWMFTECSLYVHWTCSLDVHWIISGGWQPTYSPSHQAIGEHDPVHAFGVAAPPRRVHLLLPIKSSILRVQHRSLNPWN